MTSDPGTSSATVPSESSGCVDFPKFNRLPPELRLDLWRKFCPALEAEQRLLGPFSVIEKDECWRISADEKLLDSTDTVRSTAMVHKESRNIVIKRFPAQAPIDIQVGEHTIKTIVRYRRQSDICLVQGDGEVRECDLPKMPIKFFSHFEQIAFDWITHSPCDLKCRITPILASMAQLMSPTTVYLCQPIDRKTPQQLLWCASPSTYYAFDEYPIEDRGEVFLECELLYCWSHDDRSKATIGGIDVALMIKWDTDEAIEAFHDLVRQYQTGKVEDTTYLIPRFHAESLPWIKDQALIE